MRELTRIISLGPSNYGPDVDNSSNYKAVGAWGLRRGRTHSCVKAPSLGLSSVQGGGWAAPRAGQLHVVLISQARLFAHTPATARQSGRSNFPDLNSALRKGSKDPFFLGSAQLQLVPRCTAREPLSRIWGAM